MLTSGTAALFRSPYDRFETTTGHKWPSDRPLVGLSAVWWLHPSEDEDLIFRWVQDRPREVPLILVLPPAAEISQAGPLLRRVDSLRIRGVLPSGSLASPAGAKQVLAAPPARLAAACTEYLKDRGILDAAGAREEVHQIFELASEITSVSRLARLLRTSRRTLGRHFAGFGLPVPSHWLQFARLLHVCLRIQNEPLPISRIAFRAGYPDGFTMSNQLKRLTNFRPTDVRQNLGWEWIVEAWLKQETLHGGIDLRRYAESVGEYSSKSAEGC